MSVVLPSPAAAASHPIAWAAYAGRLMPWRAPRHLRWLGEQVMRLARGETLRLVVSMPPRHGKSEFLSRFFTSWWLGTHPTDRVILVSMQERLTRGWSRKARDDFHQYAHELWGVTTWGRATPAEWEVFRDGRRTGGAMQAVGKGGTITGRGAHLLVVDDLVRDQAEAQNATLREQTWEWFQSACLTRLEPPGRVIILMTRWHHDDLIGRLQRLQANGELGEKWEFANLPALAEENDPIGRQPGEALWPERFPVEVLERRRLDVGPYVWGSLYQGRPVPASGAVFRREWLRYYQRGDRLVTVPERGSCAITDLHRFATVDLAASKKKSADFTAIASWGYHPRWRVLLLLDLVRRRMSGDEIIPELKLVANALKAGDIHSTPLIYAEREGAFLQEKLGDVLKEAARQGVPIVELKPAGDKLARALAASGPFAAHQVFFPERAPFLGALEEELLVFTGRDDAHDDQVDVMTYGTALFQEFSSAPPPRSASPQGGEPGRPWLPPPRRPFDGRGWL